MSTVFLKILNLSYSASWLILAIALVRLFIKRAPRWITCLLWALVALRLLIPFSLESAVSLLPSSEVVPADIVTNDNPHIESGIYAFNSAVNPVIETAMAPAETASVSPMQIAVEIACLVWLIGVLAMSVYAFISYARIVRRVRTSAYVEDGVMECDEVKSPFILGIIRPIIYVPSGLDSETLGLVLAHERAHLSRHDHIWKPLGFMLLSVYWFNPLSWIAYVLLCRDIESACDEKVIQGKGADYMAAYSQALLDCSVQRRMIAACPVAFGETGVKMRIKNVLNYKKPAFWIIIASLVACAVLAVCFLTNPKKDEPSGEISGAVPENVVVEQSTTFDEERIYYYSGNHFTGTGMDPYNLIDFYISFSPDGTYTWYETPISSFIGSGTYSIDDGVITMTDDVNMTGIERVNIFTISGESIYYAAEGSDNFNLVTLADQDRFVLGADPIEGWDDAEVVEISSTRLVWPTDKDLVTRGFSTDADDYHPETDIAGEPGDPIYAAMNGTITETGFDEKDGNYIIEKTNGAVTITYCHLDEVNVKKNDVVTAGDVIGTMGSTGHSTGPHLAIRFLLGDEPYDFLELIDAQNSHDLPDEASDGYVYDYYSDDGSVYIRQDYRTMKSVICDGDLVIPVDISMGSYGPKIAKFDADGDGEDEYLIAECEGTGTGISQYGLCIVDKKGGEYRMTRYSCEYFTHLLENNIGYGYDSAREEFLVYEILPPMLNRWDGERVKPFPRHDELEKIVWSDIIGFEFRDGKVYLTAPTGYVYKDSPVPDYERAVIVSVDLHIDEDSGVVPRWYDFELSE
ncbi:MAG: peptidoglycan DD-metalloendopeptidase family protein [Lachnospiraceae bacterium]|nr:peptidoglycan DD-metalloendopeptidase family protein [Lachnospiraceae bacterium]